MDAANTAAIIAVTVSVIGGLFGGYAAIKQRSTENVNVVIGAMQNHMNTLSSENGDLRLRVGKAEQQVLSLTADVARCDNDKRFLEAQLNAIRRRMDDLNGGT